MQNLQKRVCEDPDFYTMVVPAFEYSESDFHLKIENLAQYYEGEGYIIEEIEFFQKGSSGKEKYFARINMREIFSKQLSAPDSIMSGQ